MAEFPDAPESWGVEQTEAVGNAIWDQLTGGAEFTGEDYPTMLADLIDWGGGRIRPTARAIGVPYSTFRGWLRGTIPKPASRDRITLAHRNLLGGGSEALDRKAGGGATLKTSGTYLGGTTRNSPFFVGRDTWWDGAKNETGITSEPAAQQLVAAFRAGASPYELGAVYGSCMTAAVAYMDELDIGDVDWFSFAPQ